MEEMTGFGLKKSLTLPSLANKYVFKLRDENDETVYTYNHKYVRWFEKQSIKGRRCSALNQYHNSIISDEVFNNFSNDLNVKDSICEILDKYFEYENKHRKKMETEYDSQTKDYGDVNENEKTEYISTIKIAV